MGEAEDGTRKPGSNGFSRAAVVDAVVLAAGSSTRLGRPKALLEFDGRTALALVIDTLRAAGVGSGVVVLGEHAGPIEEAVDPAPLDFVRNPRPQAGRLGSIQVGLSVIAPVGDALVWPVDRPLACADTVRALLDGRRRAFGAGMVVPAFDGGRGHPFLLRTSARELVMKASPNANLRELIRRTATDRYEVPVDDRGIHENLDTQEDYERALAWWRESRASE